MYLGTPAAAVPTLSALHDAGYEISLVVTGGDRRRGRRSAPTASPVKEAAQRLGLPVSHDLASVAGCGAQLGVVVAYGRLIPEDLLAEVPMVNLHFSLLPRWRGAAPVERAILAGDAVAGVCVMAVEVGLDTGGVYARSEVPVGHAETADELRSRLVEAGTRLLLGVLADGLAAPTPQVGEPVYAHKIGPDDLELDWSLSATSLDRVVRIGGAWTVYRGRRLKVWSVEPAAVTLDGEPGSLVGDLVVTGGGTLRLLEVQPESRARQAADAWVMGARPVEGERLGT